MNNNLLEEDKKNSSANVEQKLSASSGFFGRIKSALFKTGGREMSPKEMLAENDNIISESKSKNKTAVSSQDNKKNEAHTGIKQKIDKLKKGSVNWKAPDVLATNLIKEEATTYIDWKKFYKSLTINSFFAIFLILAVYVVMIFWENNELQQSDFIKNDLEVVQESIKQEEETAEQALAFKKNLDTFRKAIQGRIDWNNFLGLIEEVTLKKVTYDSFNGTFGEPFSLQASSMGDFNVYFNQLESFKKNKMINKVEGSVPNKSFAEDGTSVNFNISFEVSPEVFTNAF